MSTFTLEKLPDQPVIIWTTIDGWDWVRDMPEASRRVAEILDAQHEPVFWISDIRKASMSLDDAIFTANYLAKDTRFHQHACLKEILIVTANKFINLASRGLRSTSFGSLPVRVFDSFEDALAYARASQ